METVVLVIHLLLALTLIGVVLMQRSEGGGLGMGGGGATTGRAASTALGKVTWILAVAFICTSLALTIIAAQSSGSGSVLDRIIDTGRSSGDLDDVPADGGGLLPPVPSGESLLPPGGAAPGSLAPDSGAGDSLAPRAE
ncbi:preprotein translocase subunit SecG [Histidinibacterium lentulum]|uniref:Protein-export membrane protein SecG n=1 Tax=Histidinibacterium lentulum TaxID=2480588 RepID=A0A3N2QYK2_9RHOB|nr:preprotein translocase subunit SecG [Histidinibacterium lentulum]ROU00294.1 preprotein translocase subunit SecG [Histidinibacterium lentulum]